MTTTRRRNNSAGLRALNPKRSVVSSTLIRLPRVRTAQRRIETGYYDRDDVRDRLAVAVLNALKNE